MTDPPFALLEIVKLKNPRRPDLAGLPAELTPESLGTICEMGKSAFVAKCGDRTINVHKWIFWVEFTDDDGKTLAVVPLEAEDLEKS